MLGESCSSSFCFSNFLGLAMLKNLTKFGNGMFILIGITGLLIDYLSVSLFVNICFEIRQCFDQVVSLTRDKNELLCTCSGIIFNVGRFSFHRC